MLPENVVRHLNAASADGAAEKEQDREPTTLLKRFGMMLKQLAAESSEQPVDSEGNGDLVQTNCSGSELSYGYPPAPAYGVPNEVAVKLLQRTFALLSKIYEVDEIDDALDAEIVSLLQDLASALGIQMSAENEPSKRKGTWVWFKKAIEAEVPTEPVVTPEQAAEQLEQAWNEFVALPDKESRRGEDIYDAVLKLRTAISMAIRTLRTVAAPNVVEQVVVQPQAAENQAEQQNQPVVTEQVTPSEQTTAVQEASDNEMSAQEAVAATVDKQSSDDDRLVAIERELSELKQLISDILKLPGIKSRVTMFATSDSNQHATVDDLARSIRERYFASTNQMERQLLRKEAERLIALSFLKNSME